MSARGTLQTSMSTPGMSSPKGEADFPDRGFYSPNDPREHSTFTDIDLTRICVVEAPQRTEDIFEFVGLFPSGAQHLDHPLQ
jgi:hypothetical protein